MEIKDTVNKIASMSNSELKNAISVIADSLGATPAQKRMAQNNAGLLKRKITGMSESEINKYLSKLPPEKLQELKNKIGI